MSLERHEAACAVLRDLHQDAARDAARWTDRTGTADASSNARGGGALVRLGGFFLAVSPEDGRLLYNLARSIRAQRIVEFGASYGISALYLAAAASDTGGRLITTEVHPEKCIALRRTFRKSGLAETITLLEGDARETLCGVEGPVDMLFLDGWKSAYLAIFERMRPSLRPGALVVADNITHAAAADYLARVEAPDSGCKTDMRGTFAITSVMP